MSPPSSSVGFELAVGLVGSGGRAPGTVESIFYEIRFILSDFGYPSQIVKEGKYL